MSGPTTRDTKTPEVRLRPISPDDAEALTRLFAGDTELALQTAAMPIPFTIEDARAFLSTADPERIFAIMAGDEVVGTMGMAGAEEPVEIGYCVGRVYWGRGYATTALGLLIKGAQSKGMMDFIADVFPGNPASMRVLEKNGFTRLADIERDLPKRGGLRRLIRFHLSVR